MRRSEIFTRPLSDVLLEADHDDLELEPDPYSQANLDRCMGQGFGHGPGILLRRRSSAICLLRRVCKVGRKTEAGTGRDLFSER